MADADPGTIPVPKKKRKVPKWLISAAGVLGIALTVAATGVIGNGPRLVAEALLDVLPQPEG